jgi:hypothetical protein
MLARVYRLLPNNDRLFSIRYCGFQLEYQILSSSLRIGSEANSPSFSKTVYFYEQYINDRCSSLVQNVLKVFPYEESPMESMHLIPWFSFLSMLF